MIEGWLSDLVDHFWDAAGSAPPPPRDLIDTVPLALPLTIVTLPALAVDRVQTWLARHGVADAVLSDNRRLRGCLVARCGHGIIFLDGADHQDERRFTLAHEVGHFLVDYCQPRDRAIAQLGSAIVPVLNGERPPTSIERIDAALTACSLGVHTHLLIRSGNDGARADIAETRADRVAWELLAPADLVVERSSGFLSEHHLSSVLVREFGLPPAVADRYARHLCRRYGPPRSFVEWLRP